MKYGIFFVYIQTIVRGTMRLETHRHPGGLATGSLRPGCRSYFLSNTNRVWASVATA